MKLLNQLFNLKTLAIWQLMKTCVKDRKLFNDVERLPHVIATQVSQNIGAKHFKSVG